MDAQDRQQALLRWAAAALIVAAGIAVAMVRFPGGYDWAYTVISRLASRSHNPHGGLWLSASLVAALLVVWPATTYLLRAAAASRGGRGAVTALRVGVAGGVLLGVEGLLQLDFSGVLRKGHELLALVTFVGLYAGVLGLYTQRIRADARFLGPALLVLLPMFAIAASQLALYFGQRELGWVSTDWRELGVPLWLSFAFWQWLAVTLLWTGLGHLIAATPAPIASAQQPVELGA
jgi:hypothetical protein